MSLTPHRGGTWIECDHCQNRDWYSDSSPADWTTDGTHHHCPDCTPLKEQK